MALDYPLLARRKPMADTWSKFLRGTFDGLDVGDLRDGAGVPPIVHTLNMRNGAVGARVVKIWRVAKAAIAAMVLAFFNIRPLVAGPVITRGCFLA